LPARFVAQAEPSQHTLSATRPVGQRGHRKIFGLDVVSADDGAGWLAFLRNLLTRVPKEIRRTAVVGSSPAVAPSGTRPHHH
jgi:hypothetical protein